MPGHAFYKLVDGTIEIDGVRMHQTLNKTPLQAAHEMVGALCLRKGEKVLDVCTGLGYTSIDEARARAKVVTVEVDEKVVELCKQNRDSAKLFDNPLIRRFLGDAYEYVKTLEAESFDAILHDPPRFSFASELYSLVFYQQLYRVLRNGGRLFHYTGKPGEKSGKNYRKGFKNRLEMAGFQSITWLEGPQGFLCSKASSTRPPSFD